MRYCGSATNFTMRKKEVMSTAVQQQSEMSMFIARLIKAGVANGTGDFEQIFSVC